MNPLIALVGDYSPAVTAFDATGEIRAAELSATIHPFFVGTLFQPERAALRGETPPLVRAFVRTVTAQDDKISRS